MTASPTPWIERSGPGGRRTRAGKAMPVESEPAMSRGQGLKQALRLATWFLARGLKPGDVISFRLPDWIGDRAIARAARVLGLVIGLTAPVCRERELAWGMNPTSSPALATAPKKPAA